MRRALKRVSLVLKKKKKKKKEGLRAGRPQRRDDGFFLTHWFPGTGKPGDETSWLGLYHFSFFY